MPHSRFKKGLSAKIMMGGDRHKRWGTDLMGGDRQKRWEVGTDMIVGDRNKRWGQT